MEDSRLPRVERNVQRILRPAGKDAVPSVSMHVVERYKITPTVLYFWLRRKFFEFGIHMVPRLRTARPPIAGR
ncbi:MAG: hypothetical protein ACI9BW_004064 [Gammaproteobacteria bacterium]|jgi:hypothetical protein